MKQAQQHYEAIRSGIVNVLQAARSAVARNVNSLMDHADTFYKRLSNTFGSIACFDREGFWRTYFENTADKIAFHHPCLPDELL